MKINIESGGLNFNDTGNGGRVTLHATSRTLKTEINHYAGNEKENREPFNTLEFEATESGRLCLFLTDAQLETLCSDLSEEIHNRAAAVEV